MSPRPVRPRGSRRALSRPRLLTLPSLPRRLVVGAPRASWPANESVVNPGAIFRCRIGGNSSGGCEQLQLGELAVGRGRGDPGAGRRPGTEGRCPPPCAHSGSAPLPAGCAGPFRLKLQNALPLAKGRDQRCRPRTIAAASREKTRMKLDLGKLGVTDVVPTAVSHLSASGSEAPWEFRSDTALRRAGAAFRAVGECNKLRDGGMEVCAQIMFSYAKPSLRRSHPKVTQPQLSF